MHEKKRKVVLVFKYVSDEEDLISKRKSVFSVMRMLAL